MSHLGCTSATWKSKKNGSKKKASRTSGSQKGENCQANSLKRYVAKRNRSYKHKGYEGVIESWKKIRERFGG